MQRHLLSRLDKLEAQTTGKPVFIWCDDPADFRAEVARRLAAGEISEADKIYCVHWK